MSERPRYLHFLVIRPAAEKCLSLLSRQLWILGYPYTFQSRDLPQQILQDHSHPILELRNIFLRWLFQKPAFRDSLSIRRYRQNKTSSVSVRQIHFASILIHSPHPTPALIPKPPRGP